MSRIIITNSFNHNAIMSMKVGLGLCEAMKKEPLVLHADRLADYETWDSVFAHLNLEVHQNYIQSILEANNEALSKQLAKIDTNIKNIKFESRSGNPANILLSEINKDDVDLVVLDHDSDKSSVELFLGGYRKYYS